MIHIIDNLYLTADEEEYILKAKVTRTAEKDIVNKKTGEIKMKEGTEYDTYDIKGYYSKLSNLLNSALQMSIRRKISDGHIKSLESLLKAQKDQECNMLDILKKFDGEVKT
jgi:hypothetical protein